MCLQAEPDQPIELRFSALALLPGECAVAPDDTRGGRLRARLFTGDGVQRRTGVAVRRDRITFVVVNDEGRVRVTSRARCNRRVPEGLGSAASDSEP